MRPNTLSHKLHPTRDALGNLFFDSISLITLHFSELLPYHGAYLVIDGGLFADAGSEFLYPFPHLAIKLYHVLHCR